MRGEAKLFTLKLDPKKVGGKQETEMDKHLDKNPARNKVNRPKPI